MSQAAESAALHARVRRFIDESLAGTTAEAFDALACDVARYQARYVPAVASALARAGLRPAELDRADELPALPTDVFRLRRVAAHPAVDDARVFATSGTTDALRGRHPFRDLETYRRGAMAWAERMLWPDGRRLRVVLLAGDEARAPESSLSYMLARFADHLGQGAWFWDGERLDVGGLERCLTEVNQAGEPALVAGTSFAFVHLCDTVRGALPLPPGSRVMQTGGFKGRSREVAAHELRGAVARLFALAPSVVVAEYGMTELSSQLYQPGAADGAREPATRYLPPPWLRVDAADPLTLATLPRGQEGIARFVDLANVDSAIAVQTADRVVVSGDGSVDLLGRSPGAPPRGCSLALEHLLTDG
ncbi:MAG: acyl-protein synthetase [Deltaproteobacteria bacterium]|nr:acyl-protein synthetase [Deltaproteobacteria bacterium]